MPLSCRLALLAVAFVSAAPLTPPGGCDMAFRGQGHVMDVDWVCSAEACECREKTRGEAALEEQVADMASSPLATWASSLSKDHEEV